MDLGERAESLAARGVIALPRPLKRLIAGRATVIDDVELDLDTQTLRRLQVLTRRPPYESLPAPRARRLMVRGAIAGAGRKRSVERVENVELDGPGGTIAARLYVPPGEGSGLLVYYHGGGFTIGDLESHDGTCRLLAVKAAVRVLSIDYRLGPEHPFPAAHDDAFAAFRQAVARASEFGADPRLVAVGGDSAGGNLAATTCQRAKAEGGIQPAFQMLIYPVCDLSTERASFEKYGSGFELSASLARWFHDNYCPSQADRLNPRASPLLADDLAGLPPAYVAIAGFDPLRDEGEEYARRLTAAGVELTVRLHEQLAHAFFNLLVSPSCRAAAVEAALALRAGLDAAQASDAGQISR